MAQTKNRAPKISAFTHSFIAAQIREGRLHWIPGTAPKQMNAELRAMERWHRESAKQKPKKTGNTK